MRGGYSEAHVPFCGHAVLETLSRSSVTAPDPLSARITGQQPWMPFIAGEKRSEIAALHQLWGLAAWPDIIQPVFRCKTIQTGANNQ